MAAASVIRKYGVFSQYIGCFRNYTKNINLDIKNISRSLCSRVSEVNEDVPEKRKEFRKFRSRIYRQNRLNRELERNARHGNWLKYDTSPLRKLIDYKLANDYNTEVTINLDVVHKDWLAKEGLVRIHKLARHYKIFEHVFGGFEFKPTVMMSIAYEQENQEVKWGNFITPAQAASCPIVCFESDSNTQWSLILTNPDGNIWDTDSELLHWFVVNIPGNKVSDGEVVREYVPPMPPKSTGFHRYVFCLLQQRERINTEKYTSLNSSFYSQRSFKMAELVNDDKNGLTPTGLAFFQADWDESVSKTYSQTLGTTEPVYDYKPFITPTYKRKCTTTVTFNNKYRNM